jgi:DNA-binding IscR family transcriptional regulator
MTDAEIRDKILAALYGVWKERGFDAWVPLLFLSERLNLEPVAAERNVELLAKLGLVEGQRFIGGGGLYRLSANGVLECEQKGLQPDFALVKREG